MVDEMLKSKRASDKQGGDYMAQQREKEEKEAKLQRRKERKELKEARLNEESKDSYLSLDQFKYLQKNIEVAQNRLKEQQNFIDTMESKMIKQLTSRRNKEMGIDTKADKSKTDSQQFLNIR